MNAIPSILALLLAGAAAAQVPPPQLPQGATAAKVPAPQRRFPGVSDAGQAILNKAMSARDPQLVEAIQQQRAASNSLTHLVLNPPIDPDKLATALKQRETAQAQFRVRQNELIVASARLLGDADRAAYLKTLLPPAAAATPPSPH